MLQKAKSDQNAYEKANEFLEVLVEAVWERSNYILRSSAVTIAQDNEFIRALWRAVTSRTIQSRMWKNYLSKYEALIRLGVSVDDLPLPP